MSDITLEVAEIHPSCLSVAIRNHNSIIIHMQYRSTDNKDLHIDNFTIRQEPIGLGQTSVCAYYNDRFIFNLYVDN